eukprot:958432-Pleurochrysis_carterae.AAC.2
MGRRSRARKCKGGECAGTAESARARERAGALESEGGSRKSSSGKREEDRSGKRESGDCERVCVWVTEHPRWTGEGYGEGGVASGQEGGRKGGKVGTNQRGTPLGNSSTVHKSLQRGCLNDCKTIALSWAQQLPSGCAALAHRASPCARRCWRDASSRCGHWARSAPNG